MYGNNNWSYNNSNNGGYPPYGFNSKSSGGGGIGGGLGSRSLNMNSSLSTGLEADINAGYGGLLGRGAIGSSGGYPGYNGMLNGGGSGASGGSGGIGPICNAPMGGSGGIGIGGIGGGGANNANSYGRSGPYSTNGHGLGGGGGGGGDSSRHATNLIVNYLPQEYTDRDLYTLFRKIGAINTCRIMRHYQSGYSFGYGFVDFASPEDAERAIKTYNGYNLGSKRLKVSYARPGGEDIKDTNLYVTNLPRTIDDDTLRRIFAKYGQIVQMNILRDKITFKPKGVAFVRFNKRAEAQEAIAALNNIIPEGGMQPLSVRLAEEHGKAKANLYMMQKNMGMSGGGGMPMTAAQHMHMSPHQSATTGPMRGPMGAGSHMGHMGTLAPYNNMAAAAAVAAAYRDEAMERTVRSVLEGVCERIFGLDSELFKEMLLDETKKKFQQCPYG